MNELTEYISINYNVANALYIASTAGYRYSVGLYTVIHGVPSWQSDYSVYWSIHI